MELPFLDQLGLMGIPLLICAALMVAMIVERMIFFCMTRPVSPAVLSSVMHKETDAVKEKLKKSYFGRIILDLILNRALPEKDRENFSSMQLMSVENYLSSYLPILKTLTTVSPLLGLLGTVLGMIDSFQAISSINQPITPSLVANGVSQALLTTAVGLILAIPALISCSLFNMRINKLLHRLTIQLNEVNLEISVIENR